MTQKALAEKLVRTYGTRDPFGIAKAMGFIIIKTPLKGIRGFYQEARRCRIIYLRADMPEQEQKWVCAHELGHALQHKGLNRIFMDNCTQMVTSRYEKEANQFAIDLLYSDEGNSAIWPSIPLPLLLKYLESNTSWPNIV